MSDVTVTVGGDIEGDASRRFIANVIWRLRVGMRWPG
jgi:hypothetical protein